jgi:signal transduction histidine kinase
MDGPPEPGEELSPAGFRERIEAEIGRLPQIDVSFRRLLSLTTSSGVSPQRSRRTLVHTIDADRLLRKWILQWAGRQSSGARIPKPKISRIVEFMGEESTRISALVQCAWRFFAVRMAADAGEKGSWFHCFWEHSVAVGLAAKWIAERRPGAQGVDAAFACGLLHDMGKAALFACFPKSYARVADRVTRNREAYCDVENEVFGMDHAAVGRWLAVRWRLPRSIEECIAAHHLPADALPGSLMHPELVRTVALADAFVRIAGMGLGHYGPRVRLDERAAQLGLERTALDSLEYFLRTETAHMTASECFEPTHEPSAFLPLLASLNNENVRLRQSARRICQHLSERQRVIEKTCRFLKDVHEGSTLGEICKHAAGIMVELAHHRRSTAVGVSVAVYGRGGTAAHLGWAISQPGEPDGSKADRIEPETVDAGHVLALLRSLPPFDQNAPARFIPAPREVAEFLRRQGLAFAPIPLRAKTMFARRGEHAPPDYQDDLLCGDIPWLFWVWEGPESYAAILLLTDARDSLRIRRLNRCPEELAALRAALRAAFSAATRERETQRETDELTTKLRKAGEEQGKEVQRRALALTAETAAGAAHELNNPLAVIAGRAQMEAARSTNPESTRSLQIISEQALRASRIIDELLRFAKPEAPNPVSVGVRELLDQAKNRWTQTCQGHEIELKTNLDDESLVVRADKVQLSEILDALIENALQASTAGQGRIEIGSHSRRGDAKVQILVRDNGVGIEPSVLERAPAPFFSHRPAGRGRGLGLSTACRLTEVNGGKLWIDSTPGVGTTVTLVFDAEIPHELQG